MVVKRDRLLRDAEKLVQKGKFDQAINDYEKILKRFPDDTTIINRVGDLYGRVGDVQRAIQLYESIAKHFTRDGFITKAIAILKKIQRLDPQRLDIFERLAELYFDQGLMVEAKREYQILADWYVKNGDFEKAIGAHERLVDLDPGNHVSSLRLADLLLKQKEIASALKVYNRLGSVLLDAGKLDEAERLYRHILEQDPSDGEFLISVCRHFLDAGRAPVVLEFLTFGVEKAPDSVELKTLLVRTHLTMGEAKAAMEIANQVLEVEPEEAEMRSLVGGALLSSGDIAEAREMLLPAIETLLEKGDLKNAQQSLKQLLQEMPEDQEVLKIAVRAYRTSADQETLFTLKAALAESYFQSGEEDGAKRLYVELLEAEPTNQKFRERMAMLDGVDVGSTAEDDFADSGTEEIVIDPDEAFAVVDEELGPSSQEPVEVVAPVRPQTEEAPAAATFDIKERLAEASVFAKYGLIDKAISHLEDVVLFCPDEMGPRRQLALLYAEHGDRDQAIAMATPVVEHHRHQGTIGELTSLLDAIPELNRVPSVDSAVEDAAEVKVEAEPAAAAVWVEPPVEITVPTAADFVDEDSDLIEIVAIGDEILAPPGEEIIPEVEEFQVEYDSVLEELVELDSEPELVTLPPPQAELAAPVELVEVEELPTAPPAEEFQPEYDDSVLEELVEVDSEPVPVTLPAPEAELAAPVDVLEDKEPPTTPPAEGETPPLLPVEEEIPPLPPAEEEPPTLPPVEDELTDELVEISDTFVGPSMGDLEQIDFFLDQELYEDAARVLAQVEEEHGDDPDVVDRRRKLKEVGFLPDQVETVEEGSEELFADEEQYIDLAKELEAELAAEEAMVEEATGRGKGEAVLEEVFREFQRGVAEQLSEEDSDTHFNLGIAYREMGLLPEAIREFQVASRDPDYYVESCSVIGVCYQEQGMWSEAAEWYQKALVDPGLNEDARLGLRYDLALSYEALGDLDQAVGIFEEMMTSDPGYRDVSARLTVLSQHRQAN